MSQKVSDRSMLGRWAPRWSRSHWRSLRWSLLLIATLLSAACGGGGGGAGAEKAAQGPTVQSCIGSCADTPTRLSAAEVQQVIAQAVGEARARNAKATIAVVDRVGNVLAVFRMTRANPGDNFVTVTSTAGEGTPVIGGLEGVNIVPGELAAIAKAVTGAYLSSEGNAFSTRTASFIVQEHFLPKENNTPSGPLFGVQFSQLPCGDFVQRFAPNTLPGPGPHRSPLGLSADAGGLPLYKNGTPVGGVGVIADGIYGLDKNVQDFDRDLDEYIATAATFGFAAPVNRRADVITLGGHNARFSDARVADLSSSPTAAPSFAAINNGTIGSLVAVRGYYDGRVVDLSNAGDAARQVLPGLAFGQAESGIRAAAAGDFQVSGRDVDAFVFVDGANANRFAPRAGLDAPGGDAAKALSAAEVRAMLANAIQVANEARAQIRQPDGSQVRVTVSVVDSSGNILGMARTRDAPVFGADVSLQKARTAALFSTTGRVGGPSAAQQLRGLPDPAYLDVYRGPVPLTLASAGQLIFLQSPTLANAPHVLQTFLGISDALESTGSPLAISDRAVGNLARPFYPDGPTDNPNGPLSKPIAQWSVFSVGLQLDLIYNALISHIAFVVIGDPLADVGSSCTGVGALASGFAVTNPILGISNGIQIFPGSVPVYRGTTLVGALGVSGDGVDQDDMVSFLGVDRASAAMNRAFNNAPAAIRADVLGIPGASERLRYINCPQGPFINSDNSDVCNGK